MTKDDSFSGLRRILISRAASATADGIHIHTKALENGLDVTVLATDVAVSEHPNASRPSSLQVLYRPLIGWFSRSDHGTLQTRQNEYYVYPIIGCRASCRYCYLQAHALGRLPLRIHVGLEDFCDELERLLEATQGSEIILATGELADSLSDQNLFPAGARLAALVANTAARLELRTKSDQVSALLRVRHNGRTTVSFSLLPESLARTHEPGTASVGSRLRALADCHAAGYDVAVNLEPLILVDGWLVLYEELLDKLADTVPQGSLKHVSVGCLRFGETLSVVSSFRRMYAAEVRGAGWQAYRPDRQQGTYPLPTRLSAYRQLARSIRRRRLTEKIWWSMEPASVISELEASDEHE